MMRERITSIFLLAIIALAIGNFVLLVSANPAGSALSGTQDGDRYYLVNHDVTTEVDRATWEGRRLQEVGLLITFPVVFLGIKFGFGRSSH
jgi:hypothetical protein